MSVTTLSFVGESGYLELMRHIIEEGEARAGRNANTLALFGSQLVFSLRNKSYPLLTTKRVFWRGVIEELLWFLRGSTDANELKAKGVHIWDGNSTREFLDSRGLNYPEGQLGPVYGFQWRNFCGDYTQAQAQAPAPAQGQGTDQLKVLISELSTNPMGRRAVLSAWNPNQLDAMALPPCHILYNFFIGRHGLSCQMYQRSADFCAGSPFNIASTAALTIILAHLLQLPTDKIIICMGDTHVYEEHVTGAREQMRRIPYPPPMMEITKAPPPTSATVEEKIKWIESLKFDDFKLSNYNPQEPIKYTMIA